MKRTLIPLLMAAAFTAQAEVAYELDEGFIQPPPGKETLGNGHGEVRVDAAGNIYVSVQEDGAGIQVYGPDGKFLKALDLPKSLHGFVIHDFGGTEHIYGAVLGEGRVIKATLDGEVVMEIPKSAFPEDKAGPKGLKLTNCDVAPNGDIYVVDGYGIDWIYHFDAEGELKQVFGGQKGDLGLKNCHKLFVDTRFEPARLLLCDRGNNRILHTDLDGKLIGVIADEGLRRPSSADFHGDLMCIAEIAGRVSVWDKDGKEVAALGVNDVEGEVSTPKVAPADWRTGVVSSPHGIAFDNDGNILETEWNIHGRVIKWNRK